MECVARHQYRGRGNGGHSQVWNYDQTNLQKIMWTYWILQFIVRDVQVALSFTCMGLKTNLQYPYIFYNFKVSYKLKMLNGISFPVHFVWKLHKLQYIREFNMSIFVLYKFWCTHSINALVLQNSNKLRLYEIKYVTGNRIRELLDAIYNKFQR